MRHKNVGGVPYAPAMHKVLTLMVAFERRAAAAPARPFLLQAWRALGLALILQSMVIVQLSLLQDRPPWLAVAAVNVTLGTLILRVTALRMRAALRRREILETDAVIDQMERQFRTGG